MRVVRPSLQPGISPTPGIPEPFTAPVGGWNARDPQSSMRPTDAVQLINWFPRETNIVTRLGYTEHADLATAVSIGSMFHFEFGTTDQLIVASDGQLWNADTETALDPATFLSDEWIGDVMSSRLFLVNGEDDMQVWDGTTLADATFTGAPGNPFSYVKAYKSRIYAIESNSQSVWYGPLGGITGALNEFDLGLVGGFRGNLLAIQSLSRDGGKNNREDMIAFIFTSGDVAVYAGSDPADSTNWSLHGRFKIGRPLGKYAFHETDTDLYVLTNRGYERMSSTMPLGSDAQEKLMLSDKISTAVTDAVEQVPSDSLWRVITVPAQAMMIVNVPNSAGDVIQHVRNTNTGAWCKFTGLDISAMVVRGQHMYFGTSTGKIMKYGTATADAGAAIPVLAQTAWSSLRRAQKKLVTHLHMIFVAQYMPPLSISVGKDFVDPSPGASATFQNLETGDAVWDTTIWDEGIWATESRSFSRTFARTARGTFVSARLSASVTSRVQWNSITYLLQSGGLH